MANKVFEAIKRERAYQDLKYPGPDGGASPHTMGEWILILLGEIQEAQAAWLKGDLDAARQEILQVAAVAVACMEEHGAEERRGIEAIIDGLKTGRFVFGAAYDPDDRLTEVSVILRPDRDDEWIAPGALKSGPTLEFKHGISDETR